MKKKTFLVTLLLFIVFLNSSMLIVSLVTLREQISAEKEKVLAEHYVISSGILGDMQAVKNRGGDVKASMGEMMRNYSRYSQNRDNKFAVSCGEEWIWQSGERTPGENPGSFFAEINQSERMVFIRREPAWQLCVYGRFPAPFQEYGLWYCSGLSDTLESWRDMKNMLFTVNTVVTFLLALFLVKFLDILFRPLREISAASRVIAEGDYHARLHVKGKDEIAVMADHFNLMAGQVESHINLLQETADRKQQFIDNFAHELRTPLTAIYGYAEYLQKAPVTEKERFECTQFILSECKRLQNMAYQLLDLAALREIETENCPVEELFRRVCGIMQVKAEKKGIALSFVCGTEQVVGNMELLITLLGNLIDNALKASPEGSCISLRAREERGGEKEEEDRLIKEKNGVKAEGSGLIEKKSGMKAEGSRLIEERSGAKTEKDRLILEVADQGIGMTKEQIAHIKEAFYRVDKSRSRAAGGAGLGLSICERIVQLHRGSLMFISEPGKGTTAQIMLPL